MPRPSRIQFPDAIYHVTTRGADGRNIVEDDRDRRRWMEQLERVVQRYDWRLFSFALMSNHFHLFVQTPNGDLSAGMHDLNGGYVSFYNVRHSHQGHLFQGRFRAFVVEDEGYWLEVSRYVHLNPVRAGLVERPEDWRWSSYAGYHRPHLRVEWLNYERVLEDHGGDTQAGRRLYREFIEEGLGRRLDSPLSRAKHRFVLGSDRFVEWVQGLLDDAPDEPATPDPSVPSDRPSLSDVVRVVGAHYRVDSSQWAPGRRSNHPARGVAAYLAHELTRVPGVEIARVLGYRSAGSVDSACVRLRQAPEGSSLGRDIRTLTTKLRHLSP